MKRTRKVVWEREHAKLRLHQRYGIVTNRFGLAELVKEIQAGRATFVQRQSNRVTVFDVPFRGQTVRCVYDKMRHSIVTALPV